MKWLALAVVAFSTIIATFVNPRTLGANKFLEALVSHELLSILVVLLTITMASVANIHLALGRLKKNLLHTGVDISNNVARARRELSSNAWYMFSSFCLLILVLIFKGHVSSIFWISASHSAALIILTLNLVVLYDIYTSIYMLTSLDESAHPGQKGDDGSETRADHD